MQYRKDDGTSRRRASSSFRCNAGFLAPLGMTGKERVTLRAAEEPSIDNIQPTRYAERVLNRVGCPNRDGAKQRWLERVSPARATGGSLNRGLGL